MSSTTLVMDRPVAHTLQRSSPSCPTWRLASALGRRVDTGMTMKIVFCASLTVALRRQHATSMVSISRADCGVLYHQIYLSRTKYFKQTPSAVSEVPSQYPDSRTGGGIEDLSHAGNMARFDKGSTSSHKSVLTQNRTFDPQALTPQTEMTLIRFQTWQQSSQSVKQRSLVAVLSS